MISNHYPMTYQHDANWLVLIAIMAVAAWIRHFFNLRNVGQVKPSILISGAVAMLAIALWVSWPSASNTAQHNEEHTDVTEIAATPVTNDVISALVSTHCVSCHSRTPTDAIFTMAPVGVVLDNWSDIERYKSQIVRRTAITKDMPFMNKTNMTDAEREQIALWFKQTTSP